VALGLGVACPAHADRISLRGGGEVKGVVVPDAKQPDKVLVQTETSPRLLVFLKNQVLRVDREPGMLDEYFSKRDSVGSTAEAQYEFGLWCESNKLSGPAQIHFERAVQLDDSYGPAHKKLGHVEHNGRWVTYDELREAQGLIKHKGRWITKQEKDAIDAKEQVAVEQASWARRIKVLRHAILFGSDSQREGSEIQLAAIRDAAAVKPLVQQLSGDSDAIRLLLAQVLGAIPGPEAAEALVARVLAEHDPAIRRSTLDELVRRREPDPAAPFLRALKSKDLTIVGRAASALAGLKATSAVPRLIGVLVKVDQQLVMVQPPSPGGPPATVGFNSYGRAPVGNGYSYPVITGAAVGPGAVAFGASSVPFYGNVTGMSMGGGQNRPEVQVVTNVYRNAEVLEALEALTGVNFGYDVELWKKWVNTSFRPESGPGRRVPQP
jgi:hypothetical protein